MERAMFEACTSTGSKTHRKFWGLINNYRYLSRKAMFLSAVENARARKKHQKKNNISNKRKRIEENNKTPDTIQRVKNIKLPARHTCLEVDGTLKTTDSWTHVAKFGLPLPPTVEGLPIAASGDNRVANQQTSEGKKLVGSALSELWEVDSGFSSEASPPASGRTSPCLTMCPTTVVAMDCEMVGTGLAGRTSELARCSLVDYHGNVLYDKYIRPCQAVTDYRTRWSGIQRHHLQNALPFPKARTEILGILDGKVVIGHALYNDFRALDFNHPGHMIRDTSGMRLLRRLAGFPTKRCVSLKILANSLLNRKIQVGRRGHSSVEDALASLDLYKLVEGEWEQDMRERMTDRGTGILPDPATLNHYMQDQYWPEDLTDDGH
ncbi:apoptosis-enhancing nuclease [Oncorhynchus mykiss]|uniref:Interferon stimulated exonuclease gene n=1 Tax=Oncorhynchus mykiss TaxID=8022 RepID=A0A8C7S5S3_ONCMY|nr:apoptosis-enhancing nuclease [Oncorhynchus mykiss]XP_021421658.2 apoptosis-enhancing nuclease [Oncorhynchus mykiss]XP_036806911.1 apoptosis-enhancing nuclease [Oncorhynchus mykiss]